jgi:signal transduction histidine kinase
LPIARRISALWSAARWPFLGNISHALRTPMDAISGMVDLALERQVDRTARDFRQITKESTRTRATRTEHDDPTKLYQSFGGPILRRDPCGRRGAAGPAIAGSAFW